MTVQGEGRGGKAKTVQNAKVHREKTGCTCLSYL